MMSLVNRIVRSLIASTSTLVVTVEVILHLTWDVVWVLLRLAGGARLIDRPILISIYAKRIMVMKTLIT